MPRIGFSRSRSSAVKAAWRRGIWLISCILSADPLSVKATISVATVMHSTCPTFSVTKLARLKPNDERSHFQRRSTTGDLLQRPHAAQDMVSLTVEPKNDARLLVGHGSGILNV